MRLPVNQALPLVLIAALVSGAGAYARSRQASPPARSPANGPAADYPVVLGAPLTVEGKTYVPEDRLNYDAVGQAEVSDRVSDGGGAKISAAHKTLPLPSYAEVTSLESGRTILVRVERRGPMNDRLIALSPGAAAQLGLAAGALSPVRVRRVNPPEQERAMLRAGGRAPERMETPRGLLDALNRKLNAGATTLSSRPAARPSAEPAPAPARAPASTAAKPAPVATPQPAPAKPAPVPTSTSAPAPKPAAAPARERAPRVAAQGSLAQGSLIVQVAAFSTRDRAAGVAGTLGGQVSAAGRFWRVRLGPFAARGEAEAALAKAKAAGYSDARIQRAD